MTFAIGQHVRGKVTGVQPYGAFVALDEEHQGLIHISECKAGVVYDIKKELVIGTEVDVVILDIDQYSQKISLSLRQTDIVTPNRNPLPQTNTIKKRYWTNYHLNYGFSSIAKHQEEWLTEALDRVVPKQKDA
jgi:general stress protein 13